MTGARCSLRKALVMLVASCVWFGCATTVTPSASPSSSGVTSAGPNNTPASPLFFPSARGAPGPGQPRPTLVSPGYRPSGDVGPTDLGICHQQRRAFRETTEVDARELAKLLHGSWWLNSRTIDGLTIPTDSFFYFDLDIAQGSADKVRGTAMMLDAGNLGILDIKTLTQECPKDARLGAFWTVTIERLKDNPRRVSLAMDGEYVGSYGDFTKGMTATEAMSFLKHDDAYLSGGLITPNGGFGEDVWDRISVMGNVLTYLSCANGFIERFEKVSDDPPRLDQMTLAQVWQRKKQTGELLDPAYHRRGR